MQNISNDDLSNVTGGKGGSQVSGTGSGGGNDQLLTTLQGIQSSLKDLGKNQNQGLFGGTQGLMFMTMALAMNRRNDVVVYGGGGGGCRRGFCWRW
jgi:hypothetical protein